MRKEVWKDFQHIFRMCHPCAQILVCYLLRSSWDSDKKSKTEKRILTQHSDFWGLGLKTIFGGLCRVTSPRGQGRRRAALQGRNGLPSSVSSPLIPELLRARPFYVFFFSRQRTSRLLHKGHVRDKSGGIRVRAEAESGPAGTRGQKWGEITLSSPASPETAKAVSDSNWEEISLFKALNCSICTQLLRCF